MLDSSHGGTYGKDEGMTPLDQRDTYFGELRFPVAVTAKTEAWKEKVCFIYNIMISVLDWLQASQPE